MTPRRKRFIAALGTTALLSAGLATVVAVATPATAASANLLANPGFEAGNLSGWSCDPGTAAVVTSPVHSGSYALAGTPTSSDDAQCTQTVSVQPNTAYTLSGYVDGPYAYIGITGGASTWTSSTSYTSLSVAFTTTASQTSVQVYVHGWYAQAAYYGDDFALTGPAGPTPSATPTHSPSGSPSPSPSPSHSASPSASPSHSASPSPSPTTTVTPPGGQNWHVAPYIDITMSTPTLAQIEQATGQKTFTLAFVLGDTSACDPSWGGTISLTDSRIIGEINDLRALGGDVAVSFGGAQGPYLETTCTSSAQLAAAYEKVVDTLKITHIDFDVEASTNTDMVNTAIAQVQHDRPGTVVSYTLEVQAATYGLTPALGVQVLQNAVSHGVQVGIVNPMTMDFAPNGDWGTSVIEAAQSTEGQMATIWPSLSSAQLYAMLGVTPMIGDNDTGPVFTIADAQQLLSFAQANHIGRLAFWSEGRDNGGCSGGVSPTCSGISQSAFQFTSIFHAFTG
ncbi:MAG TPA: carbohydrate binding domain-containing protein [Actinocrinis sp.]|uniref:carbohydrate binding domain-containing protein n=1 Tax=Actinocrinis sp. TaxID=1920516 RepID=UPI002DDCBDC8|nr:carbohydrate binding domain-containing protein [Actinocrinis sp.]HEV2344770.1 carbohydrate binding domain-containing protein [Actinocrinis sp.]